MPLLNRRSLWTIPGGLAARLLAPGCWAMEAPVSKQRAFDFVETEGGGAAGPVLRVTPDDASYVHTYYDACPWSPSERYLAATRLPYDDRYPRLGDTAEVCVIDLRDRTIQTVYKTRSWGYQTGANVNWGGTDRYLYTNDIVDGAAVCVRLDLERGEARVYSGPGYNVAPDDSCAIGFPLELMDATQLGYGVPSRDPLNPPRLSPGASESQGLWRTDLASNRKTLLVSLAKLASQVPEPSPWIGGTWYLWHSKFNNQATRILQISRTIFPNGQGGANTLVFTFNPDGSDIRLLPTKPLWGTDGGHPNWHPDGQHIIRNLSIDGKTRFCQWRFDGTGFQLLSEKIVGGGHPRIHTNRRHLVTDTFQDAGQQTYVSIRFIDLQTGREEQVCRMRTVDRRALQDELSMVRRLDGHPNWDRNFNRIIFQAAPHGKRQLYVAGMRGLITA